MKKIELWSDKSRVTTFNDKISCEPTAIYPFLLENPSQAYGTVLILPGGAYTHFGMHEGEDVAIKFNSLGFNAFVLFYRHYPVVYPAPIEDVLRSIRLIKHYADSYGYDSKKISLLGFSAGGHLAVSTVFNPTAIEGKNGDEIDDISTEVNALILCYPLLDICDNQYGNIECGNKFFGNEEITELREKFNIQNMNITKNTPPVFLWHTATDQALSYYHVMNFADRLWQNNLTAELHIFPEGRHGLGIADGYDNIKYWTTLAGNFIKKLN